MAENGLGHNRHSAAVPLRHHSMSAPPLQRRNRRVCIKKCQYLLAREDKGPIGATAASLGHCDADRSHVRTQEVSPMAGTFLPEMHCVAKGLLSRSNIFRCNLGVVSGALRAIFCSRSVSPIVTHPISLSLSFGLNACGARKALVEHQRLKAVVDTEGVDCRERRLRIERLHGTCGVFRRHKRERAAAKRVPQTRDSQVGNSRRRQQHHYDRHDASLHNSSHVMPLSSRCDLSRP